jgi:hypothetical protein
MSLSGEFDSGSEVHDALKNEPDGLHAELAVAFAAEEALFITPLVFLGKLAVLIPLPRKYRHRYHGFLAPNAALVNGHQN